jgi:hypothetical protein
MMKRVVRRRPSPALIVSMMALVLAMGGLAVAAIPDSSGVIHGCYKKKKGTLRLVSGSKCKKSEKSITWNQKGVAGTNGAAGAKGDKGNQGDAGTAVAYAFVNSDGTIDPDHSRGVTDANFSKGGTGHYCIKNLSFTLRSGIVTADHNPFANGSSDRIGTLDLPNASTSHGTCGAGTPTVRMYDVSSAALVDGPFFIWFED